MSSFLSIRQRADAADIDRGLTLCQGSFVAAAKLLDESPSAFRGRVYRNPALHQKWGHRQRGPSVPPGFHIEPCSGTREFGSVACIQELISGLPLAEKGELQLWLQGPCSIPPTHTETSTEPQISNGLS